MAGRDFSKIEAPKAQSQFERCPRCRKAKVVGTDCRTKSCAKERAKSGNS